MQKNIKLGSKKEKCIILLIKKNKMLKRLRSININNDLLIMKLISNGILDYSIKRINNKKISQNNKPILNKEYLESYNHYIYILDNFIDYFYDCFNHNVESEYEILSACLKNNDTIFLDKRYVYDNNNIEYYKEAYNKIIIDNFYYNIYTLRNVLNSEFNNISIKIEDININNKEDIKKLLEILICIYACNKDKHIVLSLFNKVDKSTYKYYLNNFEFMFYTYLKIKTNL